MKECQTTQDNTKDRAGTLRNSFKLLNSSQQEGQEQSDGHDSSEDSQFENQQNEEYEQEDSYSDSESDSDDAFEDESVDPVTTAITLLQPTRLGRVRRLTQRMSDFLQMQRYFDLLC